jgi:hypothetical protein
MVHAVVAYLMLETPHGDRHRARPTWDWSMMHLSRARFSTRVADARVRLKMIRALDIPNARTNRGRQVPASLRIGELVLHA